MDMPITIIASSTARLMLQLILVTLFAFMLLAVSPIEPLNYYIGDQMMSISNEQRLLLAQNLGLDQSISERFIIWGQHLLQGDLGFSIKFQQPVSNIIIERFPSSLLLMAASWTLSLFFGYVLGLIAALTENSIWDRLITRFAWVLASTPSFWLGLILIYVFAVKLSVLPVCCSAPLGMDPSNVPWLTRLEHLILPCIALAATSLAPIVLHTKEKVLDVLASEHVNYARIHGKSTCGIIRHHILRNSLTPALVLQFASFAELFGGSILAETVFNYPGLGNTLVIAGLSGDTALLMGITLISSVFIFTGNSIANLLHYSLLPGQDITQ